LVFGHIGYHRWVHDRCPAGDTGKPRVVRLCGSSPPCCAEHTATMLIPPSPLKVTHHPRRTKSQTASSHHGAGHPALQPAWQDLQPTGTRLPALSV